MTQTNAFYLDDADWQDYVLDRCSTHTTEGGEYYDLGLREPHEEKGCIGFGLNASDCAGLVPTVGDAVRLCGRFGYVIRGVILRGTLLYYRTPAEQQAKNELQRVAAQEKRRSDFEAQRAELDAKYDALPPVFQARIDKFRHNNPDFRWEYEDYEMFCCEEAVKLARHLGTVEAAEHYASLTRDANITTERERWDREWEEQKAIDTAAGISHDHSGNTHGTMVALAFWYLKQPENVQKMHGALAPLVGSFDYGCVPPDEAVAP